jgi:signal transduction histidine kinase
LFIAFFLTAAWVAGRLVHDRTLYVRVVEERAAALRREHEANTRATVAEERARIARELHDVVAHNVSVIVIQAGVERQLATGQAGSTIEVLQSIEQTGKDALVEMRLVLGVLRRDNDEVELAPAASVTQLPALVRRMEKVGLPIGLQVNGTARALPPALDLAVYRIVQEVTTLQPAATG